MPKKGLITLEALVKFIPHFAVGLILFSVLLGMWSIFIRENEGSEIRDLVRLEKNINDLSPNFNSEVPIVTSESRFVLYSQDHPNLPDPCKGSTCLCVYEKEDDKEELKKCIDMSNIVKNCKTDNCEKNLMCFEGSASKINSASKTNGVIAICRSCTEIAMANSVEECQKLLG